MPNLEPGCPSSKARVLVVAGLNPKLLPDVKGNAQRMPGVGRMAECGRQNASRLTLHASPSTSLLGGHSEVDPRLPIPNRTVKRLSADASADCPRESRSPPGAPNEKAHPARGGPFCLAFLIVVTCFRNENTPLAKPNRSGRPRTRTRATRSPGCVSVQANLTTTAWSG